MIARPDTSAAPPSTAAEWFARLEGPCTPQDWEAFARWLAQDPAHEAAYRRLEDRWSDLELAAAEPALARLRAETAGRAERLERPERPGRSAILGRAPGRRAALALAATVCLAVGVGGWFLATAPVTYATGPGERLSLTLADRSQVDLAPQSRLKVRLDRRGRRLELEDGQAYFIVAHDDRPFRVRAQDRVVTALGTRFQVRIDGGRAEVLLIEGSVTVAPAARGASAPPVRLAPSQGLSGPLDGARPAARDVEVETAWRAGRLVFRERPLAEVVDEFNRWSPVRLEIADPSVADTLVSGSFRYDGGGDFVTALRVGFGLTVEAGGNGRWIISGPAAPPPSPGGL